VADQAIIKLAFKEMEKALADVPSIGRACFGKFEPYSDGAKLPAAGVSPTDEDTTIGPQVSLEELHATVQYFVDEVNQNGSVKEDAGYDLIDIQADGHRALMALKKKPGTVIGDIRKLRTRWLFLDKELPRAGVEVDYAIDYKTSIDDMAVAV